MVTLQQLARQSLLPNEILIADDGSGPETSKAVEAFQAIHHELDVFHIWHKDSGFDKCGVLNLAIGKARSDYILFLDDDCPCPPHFIAEHMKRAHIGSFTVGSSVLLNQGTTRAVLEERDLNQFLNLSLFSKLTRFDYGAKGGRSKFFLRAAFSGRFVGRILDRLYFARGVLRGGNSGVWRQDLMEVNGFNEDLKHGHEDKELGIRLTNLGRSLKQVRFAASNYHLDHERPYADSELRRKQNDHCRRVRRSGESVCVRGIKRQQG